MTSKFVGIQLLRALAAILVVIWHLGFYARTVAGIDVSPPMFLQFGYAGVDLFFVISGFIICYIASSRPFDSKNFARNRFVRIYPFYAFFTALEIVPWIIYWNLGWEPVAPPAAPEIVKSFLIWPQQSLPVLNIGWTLEYEVQFYLLAGLLFALGYPRLLPMVLLLLFAAGAILRSAFGDDVWDWHLLSAYHLEFALGALIYFFRDRMRAAGWLAPALCGAALFPIVAADNGLDSLGALGNQIGYATGSALLVVAAVNADFSKWRGWAARILNAGSYLGDASYILYLSHTYVIRNVLKWGFGAGESGIYAELFVVGVLTCCFAALFHALIERPLLNRFQRRGRDAPLPQPARAAGSA